MGAAEGESVQFMEGSPFGRKMFGDVRSFAVYVGGFGGEGDAVVGDGVFDGGEGF